MWEGDVWVAVHAARAGADVVQTGFFSAYDTTLKGEVNLVTEIDIEAERAIMATISSHFPDDALLGEEGGGAEWSEGRVWIVDPLDGTVNFVHGIPQVAVSVALWDNGSPLVGVIIDVARNDEYVASTGHGATLNGEPLRVSDTARLEHAMVLSGFPYDQREHSADYLLLMQRLLDEAQALRVIGSAALDLAWVAAGLVDAYCEHAGANGVRPWDVAAGALLVVEAGGRFTDENGQTDRLEGAAFVASNGHIHDQVLEVVNQTMPEHLRGG